LGSQQTWDKIQVLWTNYFYIAAAMLVPLQRVHDVSMQSPIELGETLLQIMALHLGK